MQHTRMIDRTADMMHTYHGGTVAAARCLIVETLPHSVHNTLICPPKFRRLHQKLMQWLSLLIH